MMSSGIAPETRTPVVPAAPEPAVAEPGGVKSGLLRAALAGDFEGPLDDRPGKAMDDDAHGVTAVEGAESAGVDFADG
jgi:hypothetical protein